MHKLFVFMDKFTKPILPPLLVEKDCGKYFLPTGINGRVYMISGDFQSLYNFINSHNEIWMGFLDSSTEEEVHLERWVRRQ